MIFDQLPILASAISSISRAGLNVVDRSQYRENKFSLWAVGYWNNLLPILLFLPIVIFSPAASFCIADIFTIEIAFLSIVAQCVSYSFSLVFRGLRVTDVAVLTKVADTTVPIALFLIGIYTISYVILMLLFTITCLFILSAGAIVAKRTCKYAIVLVLMLTAQGLYAFFISRNIFLGRGYWGLVSIAFSVLVWRLIFSAIHLVCVQRSTVNLRISAQFLICKAFYIRGILTVLAQVTFIFAITADNFMLVWPILNATGFLGAIFAFIFLGERLAIRDWVLVPISFMIGAVIVFGNNYELV